MFSKFRSLMVATATTLVCLSAQAQSAPLPPAQLAALKARLAERMPSFGPIESARTTGVAGLIELKVGSELIYATPNGDHLIQGNIIDTKNQRNVTEERLEDINRVDFAAFPLKDAVVWKSGTGKRKLVVFSDPNCGYCKRLEKELQQLPDVTVYTFMIAILGDDSRVKLDNVWCVKDRTQAWRDWMLAGKVPSRSFGNCESPAMRNVALSQKLGVNGTPAIFFEDGTRISGAAGVAAMEQRLLRVLTKSGG